jgi:hypothetical protein
MSLSIQEKVYLRQKQKLEEEAKAALKVSDLQENHQESKSKEKELEEYYAENPEIKEMIDKQDLADAETKKNVEIYYEEKKKSISDLAKSISDLVKEKKVSETPNSFWDAILQNAEKPKLDEIPNGLYDGTVDRIQMIKSKKNFKDYLIIDILISQLDSIYSVLFDITAADPTNEKDLTRLRINSSAAKNALMIMKVDLEKIINPEERKVAINNARGAAVSLKVSEKDGFKRNLIMPLNA